MLHRAAAFASLTGQITLCLAQTEACAADLSSPEAENKTPELEPAQDVVQRFEAHQLAHASFALDPSRRIISPHEYQAATQLLIPTLS
ncbi:hypothetical protein [Hymenobacter cellulosilyticus]|uniref:Uncharacterized protein n=1 Tax=Hymenobacter cellulosilyticus TaxID=2932248 RepID=A0A8T9Q1H3_9BACT|nr:hypothetical protein [Hymenobacter cellulosilyticus]UOQ71334.1 hypothetical protein MUN79_22305 [Hymenobacter cellulosilyticus]